MRTLKRWNPRVGVEPTIPTRSNILSSPSLLPVVRGYSIWTLVLQNYLPQCHPPKLKVYLHKYAHPSMIKKSNQSYPPLYSNPRILYYILIRTIYPWGSSKEIANDPLLETLSYIMEGYSIDFTNFILEYITKVYNLSRNYPLPYSNLLTHIFKAFQIFLEGEECLDSHIPTINENTLKSLKFKPLSSRH